MTNFALVFAQFQGRRKSQDVGTNTKSEPKLSVSHNSNSSSGSVGGNSQSQGHRQTDNKSNNSTNQLEPNQKKKKKIAKSLNSVGGSEESVTESTSDFQTER
jgi:hypothetical protein